jgi:hypothetical protein
MAKALTDDFAIEIDVDGCNRQNHVVLHHTHPLYPGAHRTGPGSQHPDPAHIPRATPPTYTGPPCGHHLALWHPHREGPEGLSRLRSIQGYIMSALRWGGDDRRFKCDTGRYASLENMARHGGHFQASLALAALRPVPGIQGPSSDPGSGGNPYRFKIHIGQAGKLYIRLQR